ncbi:MAG: DUF2283 domain-containing protein [bacterium]
MKVIYDPETDTLNFILRDEVVVESDELSEGLIVDYNRDNKIVSIEVLDASENVIQPKAIVYEIKEAMPVGI